MENTKMLVLSACLSSMLQCCIQQQLITPCTSCTNTTVTGDNTTTLPGHTSGLVLSNNLSTAITPAFNHSSTTTPTTSSRQPINSSTAMPPAHTCHHHSSAVTSASLFGPCSHVLVTILIVFALH
ncbi:hypothetical protein PBY51_004997 [Eleginops maclovinus]|uniref:Uncharacterized protein n=1 Tax=Eleginops maclovinus TaxID=56733 RepID=A0AAN7X3J3_ELEMC|nr:hypothetical protein PBY51_004997 [Eleginops maclovinus]